MGKSETSLPPPQTAKVNRRRIRHFFSELGPGLITGAVCKVAVAQVAWLGNCRGNGRCCGGNVCYDVTAQTLAGIKVCLENIHSARRQ